MPPKRPVPAGGAATGAGQAERETTSNEAAMAGATQGTPTSPAPATLSHPSSATLSHPSSATRSSTSASLRGGKRTVTAKPKFAARRSQAARHEAEQAEAKKRAQEAEAAAVEAKNKAQEARKYGYFNGRGDRGGRGRGRGRGGHMGDSFRHRDEAVASGPFSSGKAYSEATSRRAASGSGSGGRGGAFGGGAGSSSVAARNGGAGGGSSNASWGVNESLHVKSEYGMGNGFTEIKPEDGGYISSEDEDGERKGPKQNIDQMQIIDLTGEHESEETFVLAPVRLRRVPHKERTLGLAAVGSDDSNDDENDVIPDRKKGDRRPKDVEVTGAMERQTRPVTYSSSDTEAEPAIKEEPVDDDAQMQISTSQHGLATTIQLQDPSSSPEIKRKAKARSRDTADAAPDEEDFPLPPKPKFETEADEIEWHRKYLDMKMLRDELGSLLPKSVQRGTESEEDTIMEDSASATVRVPAHQREREQATYLFQFPPVLPGLTPVTVKADPEHTVAGATNEDAMDLGTDASKNADKDEEADDDVRIRSESKAQSEATNKPLSLPSGAVGKLRIHKSGKATLDWGGTSLCLGMGADVTFLQNVMMAKMPEEKPMDENEAAVGEQDPVFAMGMGQIRGKFVVTPNWEEILK